MWGRLKADFVVKVDSIDVFKRRLDKHWFNQDVVFDYTAALAGIGDQLEADVEVNLSVYVGSLVKHDTETVQCMHPSSTLID